jgi:hypothetical protein
MGPGVSSFSDQRQALHPSRVLKAHSASVLPRVDTEHAFGGEQNAQPDLEGFYGSYKRPEICKFVRGCQEYQRAKPTQDSRVGIHRSEAVARPLEQVFIDFFGPTVRSRRGNIVILVVLDRFSKFISMYPVRRNSSKVVKSCVLEKFFPTFDVLQSVVSDNAAVLESWGFSNLCFS